MIDLMAIIMKHGDNDFSVWYPDIPANEPMLVALLEKYQNAGSSERGTSADIMDSINEAINS